MARILAAAADERERDARPERRCYGCRDPGGSPMSTSDQGILPPPPNAEQIRRREFATVRRGYDPEQVRTYLASVADQIELLEQEVNQLRLEMASARRGEQLPAASPPAPPSEDPYEALSKRFAGLIETADQEAKKMLEDARSEATRTLNEARIEADRIKVDAQAHAEEGRQEVADLLVRATTEADRVLSTLAERRRSLTTRLEEMRGKLISMAEDLATPIDEEARGDAGDAEVADAGDEVEAHDAADDETDEADEAHAANEAEQAEPPVDARYEDLWVTNDASVEIPELESLDLHREERDE
jgi:DivIVA domain-containing protein